MSIPKVVNHFFLPGSQACLDTWNNLPGYQHVYWDEEKAEAFVTENAPQLVGFYHSLHCIVNKLELFKLVLLAKRGGIWVDSDVRLMNKDDFDILISTNAILIFKFCKMVATSFMACSQSSSFFSGILETLSSSETAKTAIQLGAEDSDRAVGSKFLCEYVKTTNFQDFVIPAGNFLVYKCSKDIPPGILLVDSESCWESCFVKGPPQKKLKCKEETVDGIVKVVCEVPCFYNCTRNADSVECTLTGDETCHTCDPCACILSSKMRLLKQCCHCEDCATGECPNCESDICDCLNSPGVPKPKGEKPQEQIETKPVKSILKGTQKADQPQEQAPRGKQCGNKNAGIAAGTVIALLIIILLLVAIVMAWWFDWL